ncbi:EF-hand domain-containing protein [Albirhodobacter sp. R86504]|uniref:EF-hand domain-containing protein n=1 Tax=Albirhodobacter sp. R86504 TaxID=3093848 RepID=UPI00366EC1F6
MTFKTFITAAIMVAVSGAAMSPAFAQDTTAPAQVEGHEGGKRGEMRPKFDFAAVDADGDGKITQEEFAAHRASMQAERIAQLDADKDGKITVEELVAHQDKMATERAQKRAEAMVAAMDADGDGVLTTEEMAAHGGKGDHKGGDRKGGERKGDGAHKGDRKADGKGDGDRKGDRKDMFDRIDANDDGVVTQDEVTAMEAKMQERMERRGEGRMEAETPDNG